jgi:hypothetical protein
VARYSNPTQQCPTHPNVPFGTATSNGFLAWLNRAPVMANFRSATDAPAAPGKPLPTLED